jgi:hypothetical protein
VSPIKKMIHALTSPQSDANAELVFTAHAFLSVALGTYVWIKLDLSAAASAALAACLFTLLLLSFLNVYTTIAATAVGSLTSGAIGALIGASVGLPYGGAWLGALLIGGAFSALAFSAYRQLALLIRSATLEE